MPTTQRFKAPVASIQKTFTQAQGVYGSSIASGIGGPILVHKAPTNPRLKPGGNHVGFNHGTSARYGGENVIQRVVNQK